MKAIKQETCANTATWVADIRAQFRPLLESNSEWSKSDKEAIREQTKLLFRVLKQEASGSQNAPALRQIIGELNQRLVFFAASKFMKRLGLNPNRERDLFQQLVGEGNLKLIESLIDGFEEGIAEFTSYVIGTLKLFFKGVTRDFYQAQGVSIHASDDGDELSLLETLADKKVKRPDDHAANRENIHGMLRILTTLEPTIVGQGEDEISFDSGKLLRLRFGLKPYVRHGHKGWSYRDMLDHIKKREEKFCNNPHGRKLKVDIIKQATNKAFDQLRRVLLKESKQPQ